MIGHITDLWKTNKLVQCSIVGGAYRNATVSIRLYSRIATCHMYICKRKHMIQYEKYIQYEEKMYYLEHAHEGFIVYSR